MYPSWIASEMHKGWEKVNILFNAQINEVYDILTHIQRRCFDKNSEPYERLNQTANFNFSLFQGFPVVLCNDPWPGRVRCSSRWRTGNVDFFTFKIASRYVSRMVTKVFLGHFGFIQEIFNDLESQIWFLWQFGASEGWSVKVTWLRTGTHIGQSASVDQKPQFFGSKDVEIYL